MNFYGPYLFELSFPRPTAQFEGSSFKPLSLLAHHPWVRAPHHRGARANPDSSMPRLSFLTQYYYLHGEYPPSTSDHDDEEHENTPIETTIEEEPCSHSDRNYLLDSADEGSTASDTISNASDDSSTHSDDAKSIGDTTAHLRCVSRPSRRRSSSSSSSSSTTTATTSSTSFTFRSRHAGQHCLETSHNMGLSAFHDVFATSICPSTDILFPDTENFHRGSPRKRTKSK